MSRGGSRTARRVGAAVFAPVALLAALWAGARLDGALHPDSVTARASGQVDAPAASLADPSPPKSTGFAGPDRPDDAPLPDVHESRTWFAQGRWWAVLNRKGDGALTIWGLESADGPWVDTGVLVDDRDFVRPIVAWTGTVLVVASSGTRPYVSHALRTNRFRWDPSSKAWQHRADFPVTVTADPHPDIRMVVGDDDREWLARQEDDGVVMARSSPSGLEHSSFGPLPDGIAGSDVGGFDLIASGKTVQLVWRSLTTDTIHVASWDGASWSTAAHTVYGAGGEGAVTAARAGSAAPGMLLVLVPTSLPARGSNDREPGVLLMTLEGDTVRTSMVSRIQDGLADATVVVDVDERRAHVFANAPALVPAGGGKQATSVVDKTASLDDLAFAPGRGVPVLAGDVGSELAAPVVPAAPTNSERGLLVMAAGSNLSGWRTAVVGGDLEGAGPLSRRDGPIDVVHDTFDGLPASSPTPAAWHPGTSEPLESAIVAAPGTGKGLIVTNKDGGGAPLACRAIPESTAPVVVRADVIPTGTAATDARLLTVRGPDGSLASARLSRKGEAGWSGPAGRVIGGTIAPGTPLRVTVRVDPKTRTASVRIETGSGVVAEGGSLPLLADGSDGVDEICLGPGSDDPAASLLVTDLLVQQG